MGQTEVSFRQLLEAAPDAMIVVDEEGLVRLVNSQAELIFGYPRAELLGQTVEALVPESLGPKHARHRAVYHDDPHPRPMGIGLELAGRRRDGTWFPVEISLSPVRVEGRTWVTAAVRDITSRARVERALKVANQELEAFTYSVSHDLRAPIRQIDGFSRLLEERCADALDAKARHYLQRIQDGVRTMASLVDDLLNLARIGQRDVRPERVPLGEVVEEVIADLEGDTDGRNVEWAISPLPTLECDPGLIRIVFTNLLSNALKYTRPRDPAVVEVAHEADQGRWVITVRDNGVGFDMQYADKLFGVFQRLHDAEAFEGAGVGLATVQRIVRKHGGDIWATAAPGEGAAFSFALEEPRPREAP